MSKDNNTHSTNKSSAQPTAKSPDKAPDKSLEQARKALHSAERFSFKTPIQVTLVLLVLLWGLSIREEEILTAENGLGYALGIIGGVLMLFLLLYPVRKKMMVGRYLGSVPAWFKMHMLFGVLGPVAILYHANFSMGSLNSSVALWCMILVASSGLVGRYFYSKIHYGLYGRKSSLDELNKIIDSDEHQLSVVYKLVPGVATRLKAYHQQSNQGLGFLASFVRLIVLGIKLRISAVYYAFKLRQALNSYAVKKGWSKQQTKKNYRILKKHLHDYVNAVLRTCEFSIYERLFALWHVFHYPLFLMLIISGIVHVFAVHMY